MMKNLAWVVLALAGCSSASPESVSGSEQAIIGGATDTGDTSVVLLIAQVPNANTASLCTGEVVSPHVVLTAAHCVDPDVVGQGNKFVVFLGDNINDQAQMTNANFISVASTHFDQMFNKNALTGGHDVGAVVTTKPIGRTPLPMNRTPLTNAMKGQTLRLVGFGISSGTDTMGTTAGTKRSVSTPLTTYDDQFLQFGNATKNTCEGDSGGPAFLNIGGTEVIAGITSFGPQGCGAGGGVDTRVDIFASAFVDPIIAMAEGNAPPAPDMAMSGGNADMGAGNTPGAAGSDCTNNSECKSGVCAKTGGDSGYCTQTCDPAAKDSCPSGLSCGEIDSQHYCVKSSGGCSFGAGSSTPIGALLFLAFGLIALAFRRRNA